MLIGFTRWTALIAMVTLTVLVAPRSGASAADPFRPVNCNSDPGHPNCRIKVERPNRDTAEDNGNGPGPGSSVDSNASGDDGPCEWVRVSDDPPPAGVTGPGGWYSERCSGDGWSSGTRPDWVPAGEAAASVDPAVVARSAVATLRLPGPVIRLSPAPPAPQLVNVPTWLWLGSGSWVPRSATAGVPGLSVTATARPVRVQWSTGDGAEVVCAGPGTRWRPGMDAAASSPTCGHTYRRPSVGRPGGVFTVRATVTWQVSWVGGGGSGTVPAMSTTSTAQIAVREAPAVNSGVAR